MDYFLIIITHFVILIKWTNYSTLEYSNATWWWATIEGGALLEFSWITIRKICWSTIFLSVDVWSKKERMMYEFYFLWFCELTHAINAHNLYCVF